jgi:hypothetical protein
MKVEIHLNILHSNDCNKAIYCAKNSSNSIIYKLNV